MVLPSFLNCWVSQIWKLSRKSAAVSPSVVAMTVMIQK
jgi:hypothetical protein